MSWRSGFGLIPVPAKIVAALAFVVFFFGVFEENRASGLATLIGLAETLAAANSVPAGKAAAMLGLDVATPVFGRTWT